MKTTWRQQVEEFGFFVATDALGGNLEDLSKKNLKTYETTGGYEAL